MPTELPESYYLDNVKTLFDHVETVYADILDPEYTNFLDRFNNLSEDAKKLNIRLLNRSNLIFRLSKLNYPEIKSLSNAVEELETADLINLNPDIDDESIITLFNKAELIEHSENSASFKALKRSELEAHLLSNANKSFLERLISSDLFIEVLNKDIYQLLQMIFFGNLNQSMTDFVLRDLGLNQFENYLIDLKNRPYQSSEEIEQHWLLHQLDTAIELSDVDHIDTLTECFRLIPEYDNLQSSLSRKSDRLKFEIARQIERIGVLDTAMLLYRDCQLPPCRERQARIHHKQGNFQTSLEICRTILASPFEESEQQFALEFGARLIKQNKLKAIPEISTSQRYQPSMIELKLDYNDSVEQAVVEYYNEESIDQQACYLENTLFNGVLGLLIWEAIFTPVPGAFYNPFQYRPSDFYAFDFVQKRQHIFEPLWNSIQNNDDIWQIISERWKAKQGLANPLVDWQHLDLEILQLALQRIPHAHWMSIFERVLLDLRNNRSGFPDLIVFPPMKGYQLVEVKGPGDSLQKNQQRWMQYFAQHGIPHCIARVSWCES